MTQYSLILVAGGQGRRMQQEVPKQFLDLGGQPMYLRTLAAFHEALSLSALVVVVPERYVPSVRDTLGLHYGTDQVAGLRWEVVAGGEHRTASVAHGLATWRDLTGTDSPETEAALQLIGVHDAARPFAPATMIRAAYAAAAEQGAVVPAVRPRSALRMRTPAGTMHVPRELYLEIQTPQVFEASLLLDSYARLENLSFADDASLVETAGHTVGWVEGAYANLKITTPEDLAFARWWVAQSR